jgi:hypothetical protein
LFGPENRIVTLKLIRYSLLMVLLPLSTFYVLQIGIFRNDPSMLMWSGFAAVAAANVVIFLYVRMAWNEREEDIRIAPEGRSQQALKTD